MVHEGFFGDARADAKTKMKRNCGKKTPQIVEEGEAVVGKKRRGSSDKTKFGTYGTEDETDTTEWRIKYKCS